MKTLKLKSILVCLGLVFTVNSRAQLTNILKNVADGAAALSGQNGKDGKGVASVLQNIVGTAAVKNSSLKGTWAYESPAVVFESSNLLKKAGGSLVTGTLEKKMQTYLTKFGFAPGKVEISFDGNDKYTLKIGTKTSSGTYAVEGSEITLTRSGLLTHPVSANVAVSGGEMQMTFKADKLLEFFTKISSMSSNSTLSTIGSLAGSYEGMQIGFQFQKK